MFHTHIIYRRICVLLIILASRRRRRTICCSYVRRKRQVRRFCRPAIRLFHHTQTEFALLSRSPGLSRSVPKPFGKSFLPGGGKMRERYYDALVMIDGFGFYRRRGCRSFRFRYAFGTLCAKAQEKTSQSNKLCFPGHGYGSNGQVTKFIFRRRQIQFRCLHHPVPLEFSSCIGTHPS